MKVNKTIQRFQKELLIIGKVTEGLTTWNMLEYVNYHLHPIVREASSNTEDKSDFLRKLKPMIEVSGISGATNKWSSCKMFLTF